CGGGNRGRLSLISDDLNITPLTSKTYLHTTYLDIPGYGKFPCNGLIFAKRGEAIIFDTPLSDSLSTELINWVESELGATVQAVVVTHFHIDCLGGLASFHARGIPSYANAATISLATQDSLTTLPQQGFEESRELTIGGQTVVLRHFGEGHTIDNIVGYISSEQVLFGGCLIKEVGASDGNLADANVPEWSNTVREIKAAYPELKVVIPGHGKTGGIELLDYTIEHFAERGRSKYFRPHR
ncbi:MAG: subclass B1 metallo-beta-lactamase, partial [Bacteroidota bacterium]